MPREMKVLALLIIGALCLTVSCYCVAQDTTWLDQKLRQRGKITPDKRRAAPLPSYDSRWGKFDQDQEAWRQYIRSQHDARMRAYDATLRRMGFHTTSSRSPIWGWSPSASHHAAVFKIRQGNAAGTCFLTSPNTVATAAHCVDSGNQAVVTIQGRQVHATVIARDQNEDVALLQLAEKTTVAPLRLGKDAQSGELLELAGYGGPSGNLRHWFGTATNATEAETTVLNGDSGGPVMRAGTNEVVGVISGGFNTKAFSAEDASEWRLVYPTCFGRGLPIRNFFRGLVGAQPVRIAPSSWGSGYS